MSPTYSVSAGMLYRLLDNKLNLSLNVNNLFVSHSKLETMSNGLKIIATISLPLPVSVSVYPILSVVIYVVRVSGTVTGIFRGGYNKKFIACWQLEENIYLCDTSDCNND